MKDWRAIGFCFAALAALLSGSVRAVPAARPAPAALTSLTAPAALSRGGSVAPEVVPLKARPFPLQDVRLLDGPFRQAMLRDQQYLLALDPDRLLHNFRVNVGLPSSAKPLGGWEAPNVELRGHTVGHYLSALALMYASTGDARFKDRGNLVVAELAKVQKAGPAHGYHDGYLSAFPEELIDRVEARQRVWAPYYTLHKIMAGLLDMHVLAGSQQALDVLVKQAAWVRFRMDRLTRDQQQGMLTNEHGGMTEVLANLSAVTRDVGYLRLARAFDHDAVLDPLSRREDALDGLHANTQIPKIIGAAREYELTGEARSRDVARFFWERVALHRSYANGGHSDDEAFFPIETFSEHLGAATSETCNTYNMLKLTRHLFSWEPSAELMDFYERALFNHILASQDPETGGMFYYCPLVPGGFRTYSTPDASFWCCVGTGLENHAKYPDSIYFQGDGALFVNLFIASELTWRDHGLRVRQDTRFPDEDATRLSFTADRPVRLAVKLRYPAWASAGADLRVNGKPVVVAEKPGSFITVEREWRTGDTIAYRLPMTLRVESMPDSKKVVALLYGPILLAGDLGKDGLTPTVRYGPSAPPVGRMAMPTVPGLVGDAGTLAASIRPVPGAPLTFRTSGVGRPADVTLVPFSRASDIRYTAYWHVYAPAEWDAEAAARASAQARQRGLAARTIDTVELGSADSENAHDFQGAGAVFANFGGRRGREASAAASFSLALGARPDAPLALACTFRGGEGRRRVFDILVDGERIASETLPYHPTELLDREYPVPDALTRGKTRIVVTFRPQDQASTAQVFEVRSVTR